MLFTEHKTNKKLDKETKKFSELQKKRSNAWKAMAKTLPMKDLMGFLDSQIAVIENSIQSGVQSEALQRLSGKYSAYKTLKILIDNSVNSGE